MKDNQQHKDDLRVNGMHRQKSDLCDSFSSNALLYTAFFRSHLTALAFSVYSESTITIRAVSGLRSDAGRRFFILGQSKPECLHVAKHGAVLIDRSNTRVFLLPETTKTIRRYVMCIHKSEIRPGLGGIIDHIDVINDVKDKLTPIFSMIIFAEELNPLCGELLTNKDLSYLGLLMRDMLDEAWKASDGIYEIFKREVKS